MKTTNYLSTSISEATSMKSQVAAANNEGFLAHAAKMLGKIFHIGSGTISLSEDEKADDFGFATIALNAASVGCPISAVNEYTAMLSDSERSIAADYVQGVSISAIALNRGMRKSEVRHTLNSFHSLIHG